MKVYILISIDTEYGQDIYRGVKRNIVDLMELAKKLIQEDYGYNNVGYLHFDQENNNINLVRYGMGVDTIFHVIIEEI